MMWRPGRIVFFGLVFFFITIACKPKKNKTYAEHSLGYYYRLLAFETDTFFYQANKMVQVVISFQNQKDSVFWDSYNNLNGSFFMAVDSGSKTNFLQHRLSLCSEKDSLELLIKTRDFYQQQFHSAKIPFFSEQDSIVKIHFKIEKFLDEKEFLSWSEKAKIKENKQIRNYFKNEQNYREAMDSSGVFWLDPVRRPARNQLQAGDLLVLSYQGYYLNGRFLEKSPPGFELIYGVPDQVLKGLNYVIRFLKEGENIKIILPSPLAFGEKGSSNGTVPPFTPILYNIKLIEVKTNEKN